MPAAAVLHPAPDLAIRLDPAALRRARRAAGLSIYDVGEATGRTASAVARYERGLIDPPASMVCALAGLYRVEIGSLFTGGDR